MFETSPVGSDLASHLSSLKVHHLHPGMINNTGNANVSYKFVPSGIWSNIHFLHFVLAAGVNIVTLINDRKYLDWMYKRYEKINATNQYIKCA